MGENHCSAGAGEPDTGACWCWPSVGVASASSESPAASACRLWPPPLCSELVLINPLVLQKGISVGDASQAEWEGGNVS